MKRIMIIEETRGEHERALLGKYCFTAQPGAYGYAGFADSESDATAQMAEMLRERERALASLSA